MRRNGNQQLAGAFQVQALMTVSGHSFQTEPTAPGLQGHFQRVLGHNLFGYFICFLVGIDSLVIGLEQTRRLQREDTSMLRNLESLLVLYYFLELCAVFYAYGKKRALMSRWVRMDCFLVCVGFLSQVLLRTSLGSQTVGGEVDEMAMVLRLVRMLRLARTYRVLVKFHELWMFAHGLVNSTRILMHTLVPGVLVLYVFSCVAMELIPLRMMEGEEELSEELKISLHNNFRSLPVTMLTLLQFTTLDSAAGIYRPWVEATPTLAAFFVSAILILGIVFMNLVTAVIVNDALEGLAQDHEMQRATAERKRSHLMRSLEEAFKQADADNSGDLSRTELVSISQHCKALLSDLLGSRDLVKLFDYLDIDGDGSIGIDEFCAGIESLVQSDTRLEIKRMERLLDSLRRQIQNFTQGLEPGGCCRGLSTPPSERLSTPPSEKLSMAPTASERLLTASDKLLTCSDKIYMAPSPASLEAARVPEWAGEILGGLAELSGKLDRALLSCAEQASALREASAKLGRVSFDDESCASDCSTWSHGTPEEPGTLVPRSLVPVLWCGEESQAPARPVSLGRRPTGAARGLGLPPCRALCSTSPLSQWRAR